MAILAQQGGAIRAALAAHALVGRSSVCAVQLGVRLASAEHARLSYRDGAWSVRDLGSKNGTFVNGERLAPGSARALAAGDQLAFGDPEATWTLVDASPPVPMARRLSDNALLAGAGALLALPSADDPRACVVEMEDGRFVVEIEGQSRPAQDGEVLPLGGEAFMLHLPTPPTATADANERAGGIDEAELRFRVSRDEEAVELTVVRRGEARVLAPRSHHYMLLTLARARLRDRDAGALAPPQRGWVFVDELCRMLSMDENKLNVEIYRVRQEMSAAGLAGAAAVIERRRGSRQLRVGTERLAVAPMDDPRAGA
ncbi:FHA domain-containing protein [Sorangium sp. So ce1151]|uniref:FHA domain-containing protein n=1 Tax=Sorangium sp. So ce1151 TaxID=3133332 RepID=UPI003F5D9C61